MQRKIHRIHRLRRHRPFFPVHGLAEARDLAAIIGQAASPDVAKNIVRLYAKAGVVVPGFRIADAYVQCGELGLRFGLGCRIHPGENFNALPKSGNQIRDHGLGLRLGLRREIALRVNLAHGVAQKSVHHGYSALPAGTLLGCARQFPAEESKVFFRQRFWQYSGIGFDQMESEPILPGVERNRSDQGGLTLEGFGLPDHETALLVDAGGAKIFVPVQAGSFDRKVSLGPGVVGVVDVFVIGQTPMALGHGVLEFKDADRASVGVGESSQLE